MWNSPYINHFLQPDTIVPDLSNPQSWNRYSYVINNPLRLADPTGHDYCDYNPSSCSSYYEPGSGLPGNPVDPTNPDNVLNNNDDDGDNDAELLLACGQNAGGNCDETSDYDGLLPLTPYYNLSNGAPTIFGNDGNDKLPRKLLQALAIYYYIKSKPGQQFNLVGHSAGATAMIIAARLLVRDGLGDQINNLVLLDPSLDPSYYVDEKGSIGNIQYEANLLAASGVTVFLGDSLEAGDGDDVIVGAIDIPSSGNHLQLATDMTVYNLIVTNPNWNP